MKVTAVILACLVQTGLCNVLDERGATITTCARDNCYRAASRWYFDRRQARFDCSPVRLQQLRTNYCHPIPDVRGIHPFPVSVKLNSHILSTVTITVTATPAKRAVDAALAARQATVVPTATPAYASYCSGTVRYASACSCFGFPATITTAPTPTVYTTVTVSPAQCSQPATCGTYANCGSEGDCYCGYDTDNKAICFQSESCDSTLQCSTNADCAGKGNKTSCLRDNCCGYSICSPTNICLNPAGKSRLFKARSGVGKRDCTSTGCKD